MVQETRARVVVIGAGFGGLQVARTLVADERVDLTVVDKENHHLFQPLLYQVATAGLDPSEIAIPIRAAMFGSRARRRFTADPVKRAEVFLGEATGVDVARRQVSLADGHVLPYDYLVLAAGARTNYFGHDEWSQHAFGMKDLRDALRLKERILQMFELAEHEPDPEKQRELLTFVVVGGGPTGVELSGAISELGRSILCRDYRNISCQDIRVLLLEMGDRVLAEFEAPLPEKAQRGLTELGVEVRLQAKVTEVGAGWLKLGSERIACGLLCWAPGVEPVPLAQTLGLPTAKGKLEVDAHCALPGHPEVFVIGDLASFVPGARGSSHADSAPRRPLPGLAAVATQQGKFVAHLIRDELSGKPRSAFRYDDRGIMATIGSARAVAQTKRLHLTGFVAWLAWIFVHVILLIGFRNRVLVLYEWLWAYLLRKRGSRIMTRREETAVAEATSKLPDQPVLR